MSEVSETVAVEEIVVGDEVAVVGHGFAVSKVSHDGEWVTITNGSGLPYLLRRGEVVTRYLIPADPRRRL